MKKVIIFLLVLLPFISNGQTWVFKSVDSLRAKLYQPQYAPSEGASAVVDQTTKGGVTYRKKLWYVLVFGNVDPDDSLSTVYCDYYGGPSFAWKLIDSADMASLVFPLGTPSQYLNGVGSSMNVSSLFVSWALQMASDSLYMTVTPSSGSEQSSNKVKIPTTTLKRVDPFSGTTDANGNYTVTYSSAFSTVPVLSYNIVTNNNLMDWKVTSSTATGFTINVYTRDTGNVLTTLLGALTGALLTGTTPAAGVSINGFSTEK